VQELGGLQPGLVDLGALGLVHRRHRVPDEDAEVALGVVERLAEPLALGGERVGVAAGLHQLADLVGDPGQRGALVADDLAEQQVERLDRRRALVEGVDLRVADVLLDRVVLGEPGPAEGLQRQASSS
jgi:hypothetical protein